MPVTGTAGRVEAVRVAGEHLPALTEFYRAVWDPNATVQSVQASRASAGERNPVTPGEPPPTWLVLQGGRAIAHLTTIPITLWLDGTEQPAYWLKGLWVLPEHQRSSAGFLVLRAALEVSEPMLSLLHEEAAIKLMEAVGFTNLGALPNKMRVLNPRAVLKRVDVTSVGLRTAPNWVRSSVSVVQSIAAPAIAPLASATTATWAAIATGAIGDIRVDVTRELDRQGVDALWHEMRGELRAAPVRCGALFADRYALAGEYVFVHARSRGRLVGLGIVKQPRDSGDPRLRGVRISSLSEILYRPSDERVGLAVLRGAERAARVLAADALLCSASAAPVRPLLRRRGYWSLPANLRVLVRAPKASTPPQTIADWWVTRGDSEADGSF